MKPQNQTLKQKVQLIKKGKLTAVENVMNFGKQIEKVNKKLNIFLIRNKEALNQAKEIDKRIKQGKQVGKLAGLCYGVKSNICVQNLVTNCASKVLENFIAPFNATVINKLKAEDAIIIGMTNMDEFACGWSGETSAFGPTLNPINPELIPGGSSSGSAAAVSADLCDFSLGSETGGSIRVPSAFCGTTGLKPSYGSVSRYGLIDMTMSFDQIGPITKTSEDCQLIFDIIKGQDNFDATSVDPQVSEKLINERSSAISGWRVGSRTGKTPKANLKNLTIGLVNTQKFCDKKISELIKQKAEELAKKQGYKIKSINLPLDIAIETYYLLVYVEFFSATRKFDGKRFGIPIDTHAGPEVIRRIIGGSEISKAEYHGKYYRNALKARQYIKEQFQKIFKDVDILILPTIPSLGHKVGAPLSIKDMMAYDILTCLANISGICAISIPAGKINNKPVGLQIMAPAFAEDLLFEVGKKII